MRGMISPSAILSVFVLISQFVFASNSGLPEYYGAEFSHAYQSGNLQDQTLLDALQKIIANGHHALGYEGARKQMFGKLYLEQLAGGWTITDVYCEHSFTAHELTLGPGIIPDGNVLNTEHTWPQSRFTSRFPTEMQKSDLHHLFPTDNEMNSHRGSQRFGYVVEAAEKLKCPIAQLGQNAKGDIVFEAPAHHRGNVARAIFYFATRYQMKINLAEEQDLRRWNDEDPVDADEARHNDEIFALQGNRNPYIDFSDLLSKIHHFQ
jgi:deoxyribonuclease-1